MRPRNFARPAAAGALCFAFTCAGAQSAAAQSDTAQPTATASAAQEPRIGVRHRKLDVRAGKHAAVIGTVAPGVSGISVSLQVKRAGRWKPIDRDRTDAAGRYHLRERLRRTGQHARPRARGGRTGRGARQARRSGGSTCSARRRRRGTGPASTARQTGCGGTLGAGQLGVAHKTLPCGTLVTFSRGDRTVRVPVIDRGPYAGGREYDLTAATAERLGFEGHGAILTTR